MVNWLKKNYLYTAEYMLQISGCFSCSLFRGNKMPKLIQEVLYFIYIAADYQFNVQYSLVGVRFSVLSTPPLGLTHPPILLVPDGKAVNHPPLSCTKVKEKSKLYLYSF
jgi:hypothetical protein